MEFEFVSPSVETMVGYTPQEHYDDPQLGMLLLDPRDLDVLMGTVSADIDEPISMRVRWTAKDGHTVWTDHRCVKRRRTDNSVVLLGAARDVTGEHQLTERYRLLAENSSDIVTCINSQGQLEWVSASVEHILGWKVDDLVGTLPWDIVHPDDHAAAAEALTEAVENPLDRVSINLRIKGADHGWRWMSAVGHYAADGLLVTSYRDIEAEQAALIALQESEARYRLLAENSSDVVLRRREGLMLWVSPSLTAVLGWSPGEWVGRDLYAYVHPDDQARLRDDSSRVADGETVHARYRLRDKSGEYHWVGTSVGRYVDVNGHADGVISSFRLEDDEVEIKAELERRATFDDLTGALKRDPAMERLNTLARLPRHPGLETAVLFIDVDEFKIVNDAWGHVAGDEVLKVFADRIREVVRADDTVARMGGDEFLVTLGGIHDLGEGAAIAEKIRDACAEPVSISGGVVIATLSIGVTVADPVESGDDLMARADKAMYAAKWAGRNRVVAVPPRSGRRIPDPYE